MIGFKKKFKAPSGFSRFFANTSGVTYTPNERTLVVARSMHDAFVNNLYVVWEKSEQEGFYEFAVPAGKYFVVYGEFEAFEKPEPVWCKDAVRMLKPRVRNFKNHFITTLYKTPAGILRW